MRVCASVLSISSLLQQPVLYVSVHAKLNVCLNVVLSTVHKPMTEIKVSQAKVRADRQTVSELIYKIAK